MEKLNKEQKPNNLTDKEKEMLDKVLSYAIYSDWLMNYDGDLYDEAMEYFMSDKIKRAK